MSEQRNKRAILLIKITTDNSLTFLCGCLDTGCVMKVLSEVKGVESPAIRGCTCIAAGCNCKCPAGCIGTATIFCRGTPQGRYQEPGWCCISDCLIDKFSNNEFIWRQSIYTRIYVALRDRDKHLLNERETIGTNPRKLWDLCLLGKVNR